MNADTRRFTPEFLLRVMLLIPFQQISGKLHLLGNSLFAVLLFSAFCGLVGFVRKNRSFLLTKLLFGFTLLVPLCALAFLHGYAAELFIFYLLTSYSGYTAGALCGDLRSEISVVMLGFSLGLAIGSICYWLSGGMIFAAILAILMRIPPIAAENLRKQFDKYKRKV